MDSDSNFLKVRNPCSRRSILRHRSWKKQNAEKKKKPKMSRGKKRLSYCLTCLNRKEQLQQVLPVNLRDNDADRQDVEFVLVDFCTDGVQEWIAKTFVRDLRDGYLRYFYCSDLPYWHASLAKNTSHRLACGDILVNLDCDNFTGYRNGRFLIRVFEQLGMDLLFHQRNPQRTEANWGRIALSRASFEALGGYDESLMPSGGQDYDLLAKFRARWPERTFVQYAKQQLPLVIHAGGGAAKDHRVDEVVVVERQKNLVFLQYPVSGRPDFVSHSKDVKLQNLPPEYAERRRENKWTAAQLWAWMNRLNKEKSAQDVAAKRCVNNAGRAVIGLPVTEPLARLMPITLLKPEDVHTDKDKQVAPQPSADVARSKSKPSKPESDESKRKDTKAKASPPRPQQLRVAIRTKAPGGAGGSTSPPQPRPRPSEACKKQDKSESTEPEPKKSTAAKPKRKTAAPVPHPALPAKPQRKPVE